MTAQRRLRLLRLRALEHRVAAARVARADAALSNVVAVEARLARLREGVATQQGPTSGRALQTLAELAARLDQASDGLVVSRARADQERQARESERLVAYQSEERAERLHGAASARESTEQDRRAAANLVWRRKRSTTSC